eukprot:TRINITY_DN3819_c0_g2_i5.p1 TRINITY_DN3819_c0_g2~~TRINITY_DN3819_c0_g2_i5.p1  ORF type:complete len:458 (+),score=59.52 TRINITY_DN3819_c0_g2_i5:64-1437(+)
MCIRDRYMGIILNQLKANKQAHSFSMQDQMRPPLPPLPNSSVPKIRYYTAMDSSNHFFCNGKLLTGENPRAAIGTFFLINVPSVLFYIFIPKSFTYSNQVITSLVAAFLQLMTNVFMIWTIFMDPGIIPKSKKELEPVDYHHIPFRNRPKSANYDFVGRGHLLKLKFCDTCYIYRPPRTTHCGICNNCVEKFDHHCPWLGCCVGKRNYLVFYIYVLFLSSFVIYILCVTALQVVLDGNDIMQKPESNFWDIVVQNIISILVGFYCFAFMFFVIGLYGYHCFLVLTSQTTNEQLKKSWLKISGNPYQYSSILKNAWRSLINRVKKAFIRPNEEVPYFPERQVNLNHYYDVMAPQMHRRPDRMVSAVSVNSNLNNATSDVVLPNPDKEKHEERTGSRRNSQIDEEENSNDSYPDLDTKNLANPSPLIVKVSAKEGRPKTMNFKRNSAETVRGTMLSDMF